jgi:hypothetical protein
MGEGRDRLQDLDQVLRTELAGSAARGHELGEADLAHRLLRARGGRAARSNQIARLPVRGDAKAAR